MVNDGAALLAVAFSTYYFLFSHPSRPVHGSIPRSFGPFGPLHPAMVIKALLAAAWCIAAWQLSVTAAHNHERILAGLILAAGAPAALFLALTLFAAVMLVLTSRRSAGGMAQSSQPISPAGDWRAWLFIAAFIIAAALVPILR